MKKKNQPKYKRSIGRKIINTFIGLFGIIIFLFIISFGIMQTSTFRSWLKNQVISTLDQSLNGTINISHIQGTILTSLYLKDISVSTGRDTIFAAKEIGVNINPFRMFIGQIYIGQISLNNAKINFVEISKNKWNYEYLVKSEKPTNKVREKNNKKGKFPFNLIIKNFIIDNSSFSKKTLEYQSSFNKYVTINPDDIEISNLNLDASIAADFNEPDFVLLIKSLSATLNLKYFKLKEFKGLFEVKSNYVKVDNLHVLTDSSSISLSAKLDSLNIFSKIKLKDFKNYPVNISLSANPLAFSDITSFITSTNILSGNIKTDLEGDGIFGDISIKKFTAEMPNTHLELTGHLKNLNTPSKLFIDAKLSNSSASYSDVLSLLPTLELPEFENFSISNFNTSFKGEPTKFNVIGSTNVDSGNVKFDTFLNIQPKSMEYDAKLVTTNLNAFPFINSETLLSGKINIKGKGTNPTDLNTKLKITLHNSLFQNNVIDSVDITGSAVANIIDLNLNGTINHSESALTGKLNFSNLKNPSYDFSGTLNKFDIESFTDNKNLKSNLNFNFSAKGKYLDIDKTIGNFEIDLDSSTFNGNNIYGSSIKLELKKDSTARLINLYSNFADVYINGNFKITDLTKLLSYQSNILSSIISKKINEFNPRNSNNKLITIPDSNSTIVKKEIQFDYSLNFKDFSLIQILLQNDQLNVIGSIQGSVQNDSTHFEISSELNLDRLVKIKNDNLVFFSGLNADINISRNNKENSFNKIIGALTFTGQRLYTGSDFHNINLDLTFNDTQLFYSASADLSKNLSSSIEGTIYLKKDAQQIEIDTVEINYKKIPWRNDGKIVMDFKQDSLIFKNFNFYLRHSSINVAGFIANSNQNLTLTLNKLPLNVLDYYITGTSSDSIKSSLNLISHIRGNSSNPVIDLNIRTNPIIMSNFNFGSFWGNLKYNDKNLNVDFRYIQNDEILSPLLSLKGTVPINLSLESVNNRTPLDKEINLQLKSKSFNLKTLGNIIPAITEQHGKIKTDIAVTGTMDTPIINGDISIDKGRVKVRSTNLFYAINGNIKIKDGLISIQKFIVANSGNSKYKGKLSVSGNVEFSSEKLKSLNINVDGNLAVLSSKTKDVNPFLFGDLFLQTNGPLSLTYSEANSRYLVKGDVKLKNVDLTYASPHSGFASGQNGFNYVYIIDSSKIDTHELDFMKLLSKVQNDTISSSKNFEDNFDYNLKLSTENDAIFTLNLSKELGQKLTAYLNGSITMDKSKGESNAQGSFQLLDGSRLEFFKTLNATGELRFEKKLFDPYIDVTASYLGDYVSSSDPFGKSQEVAVKIKLSAPLSKLGRNLSLNEENFAVYIGRKDIDSDIPNPNYDVSDALAFILVGKFKKDLTSNSTASSTNPNATPSAASYVISPLLSSLLNSAFGGSVVEDIQISQSGKYYRVGISGKVQNFRYRIGGTTEALSDIAKANILVQYFFNNDLSLRLERRYPIIYSEGTDERVNEFGLRYKFEF